MVSGCVTDFKMPELVMGCNLEMIATGSKSVSTYVFSFSEIPRYLTFELPSIAAPKNAPTADERQSGQVTNTQFVFRYDWTCWKV